jgi:hypothetical protein
MVQAVSCWPLTMEAWLCARVSPCGIYGAQSGSGTVFLQVLWFPPVGIILPWLSIHVSPGE